MFTAQNEIFLEEKDHRYTLVNEPDFDFTSCTTFVSLFFPPFDKIGIANRLTSTHPNYIGMSAQELVQSWDLSAQEGSAVHHEIDNFIKTKIFPSIPKAELAVRWLIQNNFLEKTIYPEPIIYSKGLKIAGSADLLVHNPENDTYDLYDWKTSKKIEQSSFNNRCGITNSTNEIPDCNFYHYSLQLSLYRYILENYYHIKINNLTLLHLTPFDVIPYRCDYLKSTIAAMLLENITTLKINYENGLTKDYINFF